MRPPDPAPSGAPPSLARATLLVLQADVATAISTLVVAIVLARGLGPANRGIYFLAVYAATLVALVGSFGMATTAIVFGANRRVSLGELHGITIGLSVAVGAIGAALLLGLEHVWTTSVLRGVDQTMLILVAASVAPLIYGQVIGALLVGMGEIRAVSWMRISLAVSTPALSIPAVVLGGGDPAWPVAAWLIATAGFALMIGWYLGRGHAPPVRPTRAGLRAAVSFSLRGHVGTLAHQGFLRIDVLFVSAHLGPTSVGLYAQASVLAERMSTLGHAVYSGSARRLGSDPPAEAAGLAAELVRVLLLVMVPVAIVLAALSHVVVVVLFGERFAPAATPFAILLPGTVCLTLWYVLSLYIVSALHRPGTTTIIQTLAFAVSAPLYWLAVRHWGVNGAALVSTVTYVAVFAAGLAFLVRSPHVSWRQLRPGMHDVRHMTEVARRGRGALRRPEARPRAPRP